MNERSSTTRAALTLTLSALVLAAACTGSADNGKATGGTTGGGGTGGGGAGGLSIKKDGGTAGTTGTGGTGGPSTGGTPIKFCNALALQGNMSLRLILKLGTPPLLLTADSGMCSTAPGEACKTIAPGEHAVMVTDDQDEMIASGTLTVGAGEQWMVLATLDRMTMQPTVVGGALKAGYSCDTVNPFMAPDGGTDPGNRDGGAGN